jgi:hypothetical protein
MDTVYFIVTLNIYGYLVQFVVIWCILHRFGKL